MVYLIATDHETVGAYIHRLHLSIDHALAVSYRRNIHDVNAKFVARITLVKGIPFYGFHVGYRYYLKIYMLDPMVMTRLADLLRQGVVMKKVFQPFEAHLQYLLQWMADYNLYGCGYIDCSVVTFRSPVPKYEELVNMSHLWHDRSIPGELVTEDAELPRVSHCSIEVDICVQDIINRHDIKPRPLHHDFIERLNPLGPDEKLVHSMAGLWRDEARRRRSRVSDPEPGSSLFPAEAMISMSADSRSSRSDGWVHEEEYREKVMDLIADEKGKSDGAKISFTTFVQHSPFEATVRTSLESVEDLFPENLRQALELVPKTSIRSIHYDLNDQEIGDVDEKGILAFDLSGHDGGAYDSDDESMRGMEFSQRKQGDHVEETHLDPADIIQEEHEVDNESHRDGAQFEEQSLNLSDPDTLNSLTKSSAMDLTTEDAAIEPSPSNSLDSSYVSVCSGPQENPPDHLSVQAHRKSPEKNLKRPESPVKQSNSVNKRQRVSLGQTRRPDISLVDPERTVDSDYVNHRNMRKVSLAETASLHEDSKLGQMMRSRPNTDNVSLLATGPRRESSSQDRLYERPQMQPLRFPVVKDPHDPNTILRISQKSASQLSSPERKYSVTYNPSKASEFPSSDISLRSVGICTPRSNILVHMRNRIEKQDNSVILLALDELPPSSVSVISTMQNFSLPEVIYQDAFYSNERDVPERAREWAGREFKLESLTVPFLPEFDPTGSSEATFGDKTAIVLDKPKVEKVHESRRRACGLRSWEMANSPPAYAEVHSWFRSEEAARLANATTSHVPLRVVAGSQGKGKLSQVEGPTQKNKHGFKYTQNQATCSVQHEAQYMSTMSLEIHINTRGDFVPNPEHDEVQCLFWGLHSDQAEHESNSNTEGIRVGVVVLSGNNTMAQNIAKQVGFEIEEESSELDLMIHMVDIVRSYDPDILTGYEVHGSSWGYLIERARLKYDYDLCDEFSRVKVQSHGRFGKDNDKWGFNNTSSIRVTGRHLINIWRAMRSELNLLQYTMENVVFHLLHRRIPHFTWADLTRWYTNGRPRDLAKVIKHYISRVQLDLQILEQNELIARTSEQARLLGVDFFSVFSRGSQFKVESLMFRIAKPENFLLVSPSRKQVGGQNALECLPLVMEPQSAFYTSPVLVLDFQSLYPSVMIAYNYCYSTFLGRVVDWRGTNKMGFTEFKRQQRLLELLQDHINIAPNGIMYTKPEIRKSLLAKMLSEILETRVMVKSGMKLDKDDKTLQRLLNNRQLALKLIANVTYGYTSASFSGRMPCSEIADSIVQTGRETLEKAIAFIHSVERWGAEVVYGDTDSLFVHLKGRTKDQAFDIGEEIAKAVTNMNPRPVKLKFEKVYFPCVLLAKKRYVGFKYESRDQTKPDFDAKGTETVRRDGIPAEQMIEEKALKILFRTSDLSQVKSYFQNECEKIMKGSVSIQDFCFAREVKLGTYSNKGPPPPGALISTKRMLEDSRAEPQYGERVPYVVITGAPGARLIDRCVAPEKLLEDDHCELDAEYYISKRLIPPLERIFNLVGANIRSWYDEMPKVQRIRRIDTNIQLQGQSKELGINKKTLESYLKSSSCVVCKEKVETDGPVCPGCVANRPWSIFSLRTRLSHAERKFMDLQKICQSCSGISPLDEVKCDSKDCPVFYSRTRQKARLKTERAIIEPVMTELTGSCVDLESLEW
jgi:DNA polymerase zeta